MDRRTFVTRSAVGLLAAPYARAQQVGKLFRIGLLVPQPGPTPAGLELEALRAGLRDLGWLEGKNLVIEARWRVRIRSASANSRPNLRASQWR